MGIKWEKMREEGRCRDGVTYDICILLTIIKQLHLHIYGDRTVTNTSRGNQINCAHMHV